MKKKPSSTNSESSAVPELPEIARELRALPASLAARDFEVSLLRENLHSLHAELLERDDNIQDEVHDLEAAQELERRRGTEAAKHTRSCVDSSARPVWRVKAR